MVMCDSGSMAGLSDIVGELNDWLGRMSTEARVGKRSGETPDFEIELPREPFSASILHVRALLLLGLRCFF